MVVTPLSVLPCFLFLFFFLTVYMHFHTGDQTLTHKHPVKEARQQALHPTDRETADGLPGSDPAVPDGRDMTLAC